jgi:hypothetical protein
MANPSMNCGSICAIFVTELGDQIFLLWHNQHIMTSNDTQQKKNHPQKHVACQGDPDQEANRSEIAETAGTMTNLTREMAKG